MLPLVSSYDGIEEFGSGSTISSRVGMGTANNALLQQTEVDTAFPDASPQHASSLAFQSFAAALRKRGSRGGSPESAKHNETLCASAASLLGTSASRLAFGQTASGEATDGVAAIPSAISARRSNGGNSADESSAPLPLGNREAFGFFDEWDRRRSSFEGGLQQQPQPSQSTASAEAVVKKHLKLFSLQGLRTMGEGSDARLRGFEASAHCGFFNRRL